MPTVSDTKARVKKAITKILLAYDSSDAKTQKVLDEALDALYAVFDMLVGANPSDDLGALAGQLANSTSKLQAVIAERKNLTCNLVKAKEVLDAINGVLGLLG